MARRRPAVVHGTVIVDKPAAMTSHDVVAQLRRRFGERRIGHAGTLDPDAEGVLVVGVGDATRLLRFATAGVKQYRFEIVFGTATHTLDASGEVVGAWDMDFSPADAVAAAAGLLGDIAQLPPMVSAVRVGGQRLHRLARAGQQVQRAERMVTVETFDLRATDDPLLYRAEVRCSAGTYVRVLGADLGAALGGGAHIRNLRRVRSGAFGIAEAAPPDVAALQPVSRLVADLPRVALDDAEAQRVAHGGHIADHRLRGDGPWALCRPDGALLAVHEGSLGHRKATVLHRAHR